MWQLMEDEAIDDEYKNSVEVFVSCSIGLSLILMSAKCLGFISWSWFWIFSPILLPFPAICLLGAALLTIQWYLFVLGQFAGILASGFSLIKRFFTSRR